MGLLAAVFLLMDLSMTIRRLPPLALAASLALGTAHADEPPPEDPIVAPIGTSEQEAAQALARCTTTREAPRIDVIWTWTRAEQITALRDGARLLTRETDADGRRSHFDETIERHLGDTPLGKQLERRGYRARRFGWITPWATVVGSGKEHYGDQLIRVELEPDALIAVFAPGQLDAVHYLRADGTPVAADEVDVTQVTAVYHEAEPAPWANTFGPAPSSVAPNYRYREVVLVSTQGVAGWSHGGDAIRERLLEDAALLGDVRAKLDPARPAPQAHAWASEVPEMWSERRRDLVDDLELAWARCVAFPTEPYRLRGEGVDDLITALEAVADAQSAPLRGTR